MSLRIQVGELVRACFTGIWIESFEHDHALDEITLLCQQEGWRLAVWDADRGLHRETVDAQASLKSMSGLATDPLAAIRALPSLAVPKTSTLLVLVNFHRFVNTAEIIQALSRQLSMGEQSRTFVVILSSVLQLPAELQHQFFVIQHPLPVRQELREIAKGIATERNELPANERLEQLLDAASGLTRQEAANAFSLSLVRHGRLEPHTLWQLKSQSLKRCGLLQLHRTTSRFSDLGGLHSLKAFCKRALRRNQASPSDVRPRGILTLSPPGCGKSEFCKALGSETDRPTLHLDVGTLMGSLVGQTEANVRKALQIADAMAPCILYLDELEKALAGASASGQLDSGVNARMLGYFLTWLNDHTSDVFVVATANDIAKLPSEFSRAGRFDAVYFLDLPARLERQVIWQLYLRRYRLDERQQLPSDEGWSGAEIQACCRMAVLLDVPLLTAARHIVPVSLTARDAVERLRRWADGRCLCADRGSIYRYTNRSEPRRRLDRLSA